MKFRPRFSIRTLAIFVTLVCVYIAAWEATKRHGLERGLSDDMGLPARESSPVPFILIQDGWFEEPSDNLSSAFHHLPQRKRIYLWFFGPRFKLFEWHLTNVQFAIW
jgi:hypothetical protein